MNEAITGFVSIKVVKALLQAYHDTLDYDGMKSILREAGLLHLKDLNKLNSNESIQFSTWNKIINAQNLLLMSCNQLLFEIGRKFSFYLFPFGKEFGETVRELNNLVKTNWNIEVIQKDEDRYVTRINRSVFCSDMGSPCNLIIGFLVNSLEKSLPSKKFIEICIEENTLDSSACNDFTVILKIKNLNKT